MTQGCYWLLVEVEHLAIGQQVNMAGTRDSILLSHNVRGVGRDSHCCEQVVPNPSLKFSGDALCLAEALIYKLPLY